MDDEIDRLYFQLAAVWMDWCRTFLKGATSLKWTDGKQLNYIRRQMEYIQNNLANRGFQLPEGFVELPPLMDEKYMKNCEEIQANALKALDLYQKNEDYNYLLSHQQFLGAFQTSIMTVEPKEVLSVVSDLQEAIEKKDFPTMRRFSDVGRVTDSFKACRLETEELIEDSLLF